MVITVTVIIIQGCGLGFHHLKIYQVSPRTKYSMSRPGLVSISELCISGLISVRKVSSLQPRCLVQASCAGMHPAPSSPTLASMPCVYELESASEFLVLYFVNINLCQMAFGNAGCLNLFCYRFLYK